MSLEAAQRLKALEQLNSNRDWVNRDLYRLMYKEDLYIIAYERIKSEPGNMTPGTDEETLDGFSLEAIRKLIHQMRDQSFHFKPARTEYIPKSNGKMRRLGIPTVKDKIVQEVMRMILQAIYDSPEGPYFTDASHGFRPLRSCHTALREFRNKWSAVNWIIEGDIRACFDEIDHEVLESILRKKIQDERFINLVRKLLSAGYMDMQGPRKDSLAGTPQGGIVSPILANIYLHELDQKVEELRLRLEKGKTKRPNLAYKRLAYHKLRLRLKGETNSKRYKELTKQLRRTPSTDTADPNFVRIKYLRYADNWILGLQGSHALAEQIKEEVKTFLKDTLKLELSDEKTHITNARTEEAFFLGTTLQIGRGGEPVIVTTTNRWGKPFKRRSTGWETVMKTPIPRIIAKLAERGICTAKGEPIGKRGWINLDVDQILSLYSGINRGIQNYYRFTDNFVDLSRIQYIVQHSCARTLAQKFKRSPAHIFRKHGRNLKFRIQTAQNKERQVTLYLNTDWTKRRDGFASGRTNVDIVQMALRMRTRSKLDQACCICGSTDKVIMHHIRHIRKAGGKPLTGFNAILRALNRKQIPVCESCHQKILANTME